MLLRIALAFLAGGSLSLAYEPVAFPYLMPLALTGFAWTTRDLRARAAWIPGLVFGIAFYFPHIYWMRGSIGTDAWIALAGIEAVFYGLLGALSPSLQRLRGGPLWLAAAWVTMELWRSGWPFSGMPWGRLAYGIIDTPFASMLAYVGMSGAGFILCLMGFLLAAAITAPQRPERLRWAGATAGLVVVALVPALVPWTLSSAGTATLAVVQGNVPAPANDLLANHEQVTQNHVDATVALGAAVAAGEQKRPDFVVWPENSTAVDPFLDDDTNRKLNEAVAAVGVPVLVGAIVDAGPDHILNQGIVWDPASGAGDRYTKWHPVPYGEYIPFRKYLQKSIGRLRVVPRDMRSGTRQEPLRIAGVSVADAICFDIAYDDGIYTQVKRGAEMLTVQTSNASFIFTDQIDQQFAITRLRAIETGRPVVVAATNGISGVIRPDGSVQASAAPRTQDVLVEKIGLREGVTPGVRLGGWLAWGLPLVTLVGWFLRVVAYRRSKVSLRGRAALSDELSAEHTR